MPSFAALRSLFIVTFAVVAGAVGTSLMGHLVTTRHDTALGASIVVGGSLLYYRLMRRDEP